MDLAEGDARIEHQNLDVNSTISRDKEKDFGNHLKFEEQNSSSSFSSSDTSSDGDFFQLDPTELDNLATANSKHIPLASEPKVLNGRGRNLFDEKSTFSFSPDIPISHPSSDNFGATMQSPPAQTMGRMGVFDPNRIPASIFERAKSTAPMEWSVASNESLFSIHIGNSSFSRDHVFLLGRSDELINYPGSSVDSSYTTTTSTANSSPVSMGVKHGLEQMGASEAANAEAMEAVMRVAAEEHANGNKLPLESIPHSNSLSYNSDGSVTSYRSFAFPILAGDKNESVKMGPAHQLPKSEQPQQPAALAEAAKAPPAVAATARNRWFPRFSCSYSFSCCCWH